MPNPNKAHKNINIDINLCLLKNLPLKKHTLTLPDTAQY